MRRIVLFCHPSFSSILNYKPQKNALGLSFGMPWTRKKYIHTSRKMFRKTKLFTPVSDLYTNPLDRLQPFLEIPLLPASNYVFKPSKEEMCTASQMFEPLQIKKKIFEFLGSFPNPHIMPQWDLPEVAFIGRSNVGKSSLLAAMFAQVPEITVRCSSKPGHTKLMNVFRVGKHFNLVDMPGYGFNMPGHFELSVEAYIKSRRNLTRVFMLVDGNTGPEEHEFTCVEMMEETTTPYVIVMTKIDKAQPARLLRNVLSVMKFVEESKAVSCFPQPFLVSSMNGEGLSLLQAFVAYITGNLEVGNLTGSSQQTSSSNTD